MANRDRRPAPAAGDPEGLGDGPEPSGNVTLDEGHLGMALDPVLDPHMVLAAVRDASGRIVDFTVADVNVVACSYMRLTSQDLAGSLILERLPAAAGTRLLAVFADAVMTGHPLELQGIPHPHEPTPTERRYDVRGIPGDGSLAVTWRDVTQRHAAEVAALASDRHVFEAMFQDHAAVMLLVDPATATIADANPAAATFYGYPMEELRSMPVAQINTMAVDELAHRLVEAPSSGHFVFSHRLASGEIRRVDVHSSPIRDGRPLLFSIIVDIEDRVRAEEALAESENLYRLLSENADGAVLLVSPAGTVIWASPSIERLLGYSPAEAMALDGAALVHPDDLDAARAAVPRGNGQVPGAQVRFRCKDGQYRWMAATSRPVTDPDGTVTGRIDTLRDIHDQVLAVQARAASEESLRVVLDTSRDTMIRIGLDGRVGFVNRRVTEMSGVPAEQWIGKTFEEMGVPAELAQSWEAHRRRVFATGEPVTFEFEIDDAEGHRWYETNVAPEIGADGEVTSVVQTSRDITKRKEAQAALEASRALLEQAQRIAHVGSWTLDNATNHVTWSEELFLMQGLDPAGSVPDYTEHSRLFTPESWQELSAALPITQETGVPYELDLEMLRPDGTQGWMLARGEAVRDAAGAIVGLTGVALDITERKNTSEVLAGQTARLELVLSASQLGLWDWNMVTGETVFDERWAQIVGYRLEELQPVSIETWRRLSHPDDLAASDALIEEHAKGLSPRYDIECRMRHRDGHWVWVRDRGEIVEWTSDGRPLRMTGTHEDISGRRAAAAALAASEDLLRVVLDTSRDTVIRIGLDGRVEFVNQRVTETSGIPFEQWMGRPLDEMGYPAELAQTWDAHRRLAFATAEPVTYEFEIDNAEGHRWYETTVAPEIGPDGTVAHVIETSRDITDRMEAQAALEASRALLEQAQRIAHVGSWTLDLATNQVTLSREMYLMRGLDPESPVPDYTESDRFFTPESLLRLNTAISQTQTTGSSYDLELELVRPDGSHGWMLARGEAVRNPEGGISAVQGVALDITERKNVSDALQVLATHDQLTGLANRAALLDEITRAVSAIQRSGRSAAVLMMDLDRFKDVNDTMGHAAGDDLLVAAAARVEHVVRAGDLVARLGGDEFVVVMRDLDDPTEAVRAASRLVDAFRAPFTSAGMELYSTASIGVAIATGTGTTERGTSELGDAAHLLREADTAMYAAKDTGRDRVSVFNEDLHDAATRRLSIEIDLRHALERDQLAVWYQPEIDLTTGAVVAVEALLRWHHPDGSVWTADGFIDVAEDTGLILDIGDWVLRQACAQAAAWTLARPDRPITVRVNASALQLAETGLLPAIDDALTASGLDPGLLCIEITETALLRQTSTARGNLAGIHARGISLAIDDFGTGYASLTYLSQYPVDVIKIDRSFIIGTTDPDHDHRLVAGIIALAMTLGITVTAEGVEHPDQATHLRQMGCPSAQGFLYSPALPPDQITPLLDHAYPHG